MAVAFVWGGRRRAGWCACLKGAYLPTSEVPPWRTLLNCSDLTLHMPVEKPCRILMVVWAAWSVSEVSFFEVVHFLYGGNNIYLCGGIICMRSGDGCVRGGCRGSSRSVGPRASR